MHKVTSLFEVEGLFFDCRRRMAEPQSSGVLDEDTLKPFYQRASEAEDRLTRLEAALISKDESKLISELQEENKKLATENAKLQYRIRHLVRAIRD
ncbi:uncharacterized protein LOC126798811 [Argentina anserina]|uniref:uncharacterized protein LOC126798811 n=1 Tax=Argentina anserina TaxID=57926 RepID=UPI00217668A8|nr:uncharacterized protein LOC126798811 [Potentilla anserina]